MRPLREDEESWHEQIRGNFMYPVADAFASPPTTTEGAQFPKPRPLRSVISAGKEVVYLSSKESVGSSNGELSPWSNVFAGLSRTAETKTGAGGSRSSGSASSRNPDAGATPSIAAHEEEETEEEEDVAAHLVSRKRVRSETTSGVVAAPLTEIKKKTPEKGVKFTEPEPKRPKITIKSSQTIGGESAKEKNVAEKDVAKAVEAQRKAEERQKKVEEEKKRKAEEDKKKKAEEEKRAEEARKKRASELEKEREQKKAVEKPVDVPEFEILKGPERRQEPEVSKPTHPAHAEAHDRSKIVTSKGSGRYVSSGASSGGAGGYNPNIIGAKDTVGDIYYKSYTEEERGNVPHQAPWGLKQRDTFQEFGPCRDWFLNSFTPGEVNRQRAKTHEMLYRTYVIGEANARAANHQIVREWRTMVRERADWEGYRERMLKRITDFEKSKAAFDEEKAKFDADKKAEEWGRGGLKNKLQAAEQQLAKENAEFKRICEKDNERAFAARNKIVELEAKIAELTARVEDAQAAQVAKQQIEVELADVKVQLSGKDKDLQAKDVEIADLKRRLNDQIDRCESLEIDLEAEKVKAATAEEARAVSAAALNVAQTNYSEAQGIIDTLVSEAEWMRGRGVVLVANSILNTGELDRAVAALTDAARAANVELTRAESAYDNFSLPVIDLVVEALKKDDWCQRLKAILDPPVTVKLSDEEETAGDDGGNGGDDGGNDDDGDDDGDQS
ncbi:caldesmon-like [Helianthus annuus]|uniref:caldesmon-like n=1 Tax=Helianthus annuus TaxID=4232 RepID=UPI000B8F1F9B|nr:caldesmon-like [Helianthus annuus]